MRFVEATREQVSSGKISVLYAEDSAVLDDTGRSIRPQTFLSILWVAFPVSSVQCCVCYVFARGCLSCSGDCG